jgi:hypothetical protein
LESFLEAFVEPADVVASALLLVGGVAGAGRASAVRDRG